MPAFTVIAVLAYPDVQWKRPQAKRLQARIAQPHRERAPATPTPLVRLISAVAPLRVVIEGFA